MSGKLSFTLDVTGDKIDRIQNISYAECRAEGYSSITNAGSDEEKAAALGWYRREWDADNGHGSWDENPWVWVLSFYPTSMWVKGEFAKPDSIIDI